MMFPLTLRPTAAGLFAVALFSFLLGGTASAFTPPMLKLSGKPHTGTFFDNIGWAVGCSEKWVVSTAPADATVGGASGAGAAYVYSATTGRFSRKIRPADLAAGNRFGQDLSVCGDFALIAAPGQGDGAVYLCNLASGVVVRKFVSPTVSSGFGTSVALSADFAVIGAYQENTDAGAVYVYKLASAAAPVRIAPPAPAAGSQFGFKVAVQNDLVVASAFSSDLAATDAGAVFVFSSTGNLLTSIIELSPSATNYFGTSLAVSGREVLIGGSNHAGGVGRVMRYDMVTAANTGTLVADDGQTGDIFGSSVAVNGNIAIVGAPGDDDSGTDAGAAYLFDVKSGTQLRKLHMPSGINSASFGVSVALWGNQAVIGALYDTDIGQSSGAAYLCRPVIGEAPLVSIARSGDSAASTQNGEFATFSTAYINGNDANLFQATLGGPGGAGITGVWNSLRHPSSLDVLIRTKQNLDNAPGPNLVGVKPATLGTPVLSNSVYGLAQATLTGTGVNATNNKALFVNDPLNNVVVPVLRTGTDIGFGQLLNSIQDVVQAESTDIFVASITKRIGVGGVDATKDSAILVQHHLTGEVARFEEGSSAPGGGKYGQFSGRVASGKETSCAFTAFYIPSVGATPLPALFRGEFGGAAARLVTKGDQAADCAVNVVYSSFVAEAHQNFSTYFKAILSGPGVTPANNTGFWHDLSGLIARTGSEIEPGLTVLAIEKFWPIAEDQTLFQVTLKGAGVSAANNRALYLWQSGKPLLRIMRTGSFADPACGQAKIASILQVGVHTSSGEYVILASLSGSGAATNQGVWVGGTHDGNATNQASLRLPSLVLRKGTTVLASSGQTTTIKSIALSSTTNAAGAGNIGKGLSINGLGNIALIVEFTDKAREVMTLFR